MQNKKDINNIGHLLADTLKCFYGSIKFNIQNGKYVNANIEESIKPEKDDSK